MRHGAACIPESTALVDTAAVMIHLCIVAMLPLAGCINVPKFCARLAWIAGFQTVKCFVHGFGTWSVVMVQGVGTDASTADLCCCFHGIDRHSRLCVLTYVYGITGA